MRSLTLAAVGFGAIVAATGAVFASEAVGTWQRPSTGTQVQFYDCAGKLCAKIVGVKDDAKKSTVGTVIMKGAAKSGEGEWKGDLLNTDNGQTYSGVVKLEGPRALSLKGCVAGGLICTGETWTKIK
jgi:uncharacterized protein (DUF2147 family)